MLYLFFNWFIIFFCIFFISVNIYKTAYNIDNKRLILPYQQIKSVDHQTFNQPGFYKLSEYNLFDGTVALKKEYSLARLNLVLQGTLLKPNSPAAGSALISDEHGNTKFYKKGETLLDKVYLEEVLSDRVILNNNGQRQKLILPVTKLRQGGSHPLE